MSRVFFQRELEGVATYWRIYRRDGIALGFTSHDRDLTFGGMCHRAAPGMLPSAIRRTNSLSADSAEVQGALSHSSISEADLARGRYDGARIEIGAVDWESGEAAALYSGEIGRVENDGRAFTAELVSAKSQLEMDLVPRTSPTCRARFCGPGCNLSAAVFTSPAVVTEIDLEANSIRLNLGALEPFVGGQIRMLGGPQAGLNFAILGIGDGALVLDRALDGQVEAGTRALIREGCDHTHATCSARFANSVNFRGEPFLPGNDLLARYPTRR